MTELPGGVRRFNLALRIPAQAEARGRREWETCAARTLADLVREQGFDVIDGAVEFAWSQFGPGCDWMLLLRAHVMPVPGGDLVCG